MKLSWRRRLKGEVEYHGIEIMIIMEQYQSTDLAKREGAKEFFGSFVT